MTKKHQTPKQQRKNKPTLTDPRVLTFSGHLQELRQRLLYIAACLVLFSGLGFMIREQLIEVLLAPAAAQQFIYTSPVGGFDFIFRISLYFGLALSVPVLMYHLFQYLAPLLPRRSSRFVVKATLLSCCLAIAGVAFGYFASLPAAMNFLLHQFTTDQIQALLSIQEYMSFVMIYLVGFALLFQIPIILLLINRIKPLTPPTLMRSQRFVIVGAAILAALLTPTADIINMMIMAVPIVVMYQVGVVIVLIQNRRAPAPSVETSATPSNPRPQPEPVPKPVPQPAPSLITHTPLSARPLPLNSHRVIQ